jgi:tetratricopeptide (TPR) repeat protein
MSRGQLLSLWILVGAASLAARQAPTTAPPSTSVTDLIAHYVDWVQGRRPAVDLVAVDLDAARVELARLAPVFLVPVQGMVTGLKGACPTVTFAIAGSTVSTSATTEFERGACGLIANGATVKVIRLAPGSRPAARVAMERADDLTPQSAIAATVAAQSKQTIDEQQRRLLTTFALELAESSATRQAAAAARLIEWACPYVRRHSPLDEFDRAWQLAALAVLEGGIDAHALQTHVAHMQSVMPNEPRLVLARAIAEEQATAPTEAVYGQVDAVGNGQASILLARRDADRAQAAERAIARFQEAMHDESLRPEASLRLGHVQLGLRRYDDALAAWTNVETLTTDPALVYLAHLFRGLALEGLGRSAEAGASYLQALKVSPGAHSATMRLAALEFQNGHGDDAARRIEALLRDDDPRTDPWWAYYAADWRFWYPSIERVRSLIRQPSGRGSVTR